MDEDIIAFWRAQREASRMARAASRLEAPRLLTRAGIGFVSKNEGAHLIVEGVYDFWPGTGLWMMRANRQTKHVQKRGRGITSLINHIRGVR